MGELKINKYCDIIKLLEVNSVGKDFCEFQKRIIKTDKKIIGVKMDCIRKLAKSIVKQEKQCLFEESKRKFFEEIVLEGLTISLENDRERAIAKLFDWFDCLDNWAVVDMVAGNIKFMKNKEYEDNNLCFIKKLLKDEREFVVRFGVVLLLKFYVRQEYLDVVFDMLKCINCDKYYVNMAISWLFSEIFIKNPHIAEKICKKIIKINHYNNFIINKAIQKACDSFRIDIKIKNKLRELKLK